MSSLRVNEISLAEMDKAIIIALLFGVVSIGVGAYAIYVSVRDGGFAVRVIVAAASAILIMAGVIALLFATEGMKVVVGEILPEIAILRRRIQEIESKRGDGPAIVKRED